jgi:hypothetical protein
LQEGNAGQRKVPQGRHLINRMLQLTEGRSHQPTDLHRLIQIAQNRMLQLTDEQSHQPTDLHRLIQIAQNRMLQLTEGAQSHPRKVPQGQHFINRMLQLTLKVDPISEKSRRDNTLLTVCFSLRKVDPISEKSRRDNTLLTVCFKRFSRMWNVLSAVFGFLPRQRPVCGGLQGGAFAHVRNKIYSLRR